MEKVISNAAQNNPAAFFNLISHPFKFKMYLLKNLPAAYFSGLKVKEATPSYCTVSIAFKWFTRNPFRSTYFACLSMAAELSTGILAMAAVYKKQPAVSLLVIGIEGKFYKKATGISWFTCNEGSKFSEAVQQALTSGQPQEVKASSVGKNDKGELVAEFWITWSFKVKAASSSDLSMLVKEATFENNSLSQDDKPYS